MVLIKEKMKIDDSLDVFAVHGVGGILGTLAAAVFVSAELGGAGLADGMTIASQLGVQATGVAATVVWSIVATLVIVYIAKAVCGLRATDDEMNEGLDLSYHGERDYNF